jgi:DNA-binding transcriptional ArsR family regulator
MLNQLDAIDVAFHALADPTRRAMVERLSRGPISVGELAKPLTMSLPAVMQHLAILESSGLISSAKVGRVRTCKVEPAALRKVEQWLAGRRAMWERAFDRLGDYLLTQEEASKPDSPKPRRKL